MDMHCIKCGEPWDVHHVLHDAEPDEFKFGENKGVIKECPACKGKAPDSKANERMMFTQALADIMGDDIDGMASAMDDFPEFFD
jgi:hypothetical protein